MIDQEKIHNQYFNKWEECNEALDKLRNKFSSLPDKQQAWNNLHKLTTDEDGRVRSDAAEALGFAYFHVPDKQQAWNDLHKLTNDEYWYVRYRVSDALGSAYFHVPDKQQAWNDLRKLTTDENSNVRPRAAEALGSAFPHMPDKQQAWNDLHKLTNDEDRNIRFWTAIALGSAFSHMPDKQQAWNDLHKLTTDENSYVRSGAANALGFAFYHMSDKQQTWNDLHKLTTDENSYVRSRAAIAFGFAFSHMPDKQQAWNDLHKLTTDENSYVRSGAANALSSAFFHVPDKQQAWNDLHRLICDENSDVRSRAAIAFGSAFSHMPDKQQACNDLYKLTNDEDWEVRTYTNHSLGKVSIFKASQSENKEDYKNELEKAIEFFEKSAQESNKSWVNPAQFCLPFYRSFHTIIFKKQEAKEEVDKYLAEAKYAVGSSKSKELLFEVVENLSEALKEVQNLENLDLEIKKSQLNFYRRHCDRAEELMKDAEELAPFATIAMKKGLPILDRNLKELLEEIQNKAKIACKESKGTAKEEIACAVSKEVQKWEIGGSQEEVAQKVEDIACILKIKVKDFPENEYFLNKIEAMRHETNLMKQLETMSYVIGSIPTVRVVSEQELDQKLDEKFQKFDLIFGEIIYIKDKLSCISFDISKIKLNSADVISNLKSIKEELEKLSKIEGLNTISIEKLDSIQAEKLNGLNNDIFKRLEEIKILVYESSKDNYELYKEYSERVDEFKQSKYDRILQRFSAAISLINFATTILVKIAH
ncbi:HEAT repeat domain-containing protein [Methanosarcina sp. DH2]|uniref:HEAT repeat domain-containing protein n=1 Tax=Methanosarcina sp. DH2 TaxID=2605639 RepID=UPI001E4C1E3D|nr:HEAT repeat domain-containing protein [Methanosarcina sp. DH2]